MTHRDDGPRPTSCKTVPIDEVVRSVKAAGNHFFDVDTKRFFRSRPDDIAFLAPSGRYYFVDSVGGAGTPVERQHRVQVWDPKNADMHRLGYGATHDGTNYPSKAAARAAAKRAACPEVRYEVVYERLRAVVRKKPTARGTRVLTKLATRVLPRFRRDWDDAERMRKAREVWAAERRALVAERKAIGGYEFLYKDADDEGNSPAERARLAASEAEHQREREKIEQRLVEIDSLLEHGHLPPLPTKPKKRHR